MHIGMGLRLTRVSGGDSLIVGGIVPNPFSFTPQTDVALSTLTTSNIVAITGNTIASPVTITGGGEYRILNASDVEVSGYTTSAGTIQLTEKLQLRNTTSGSYGVTTVTTVTVGGRSVGWAISTEAVDTTPDAFSFTDAVDAVASTLTASNIVAIAGINTAATVTITGGEYRILNASDVEVSGYTTAAGSIAPTEKLQLRNTSSASYGTTVNTTVTVGGVSDTWSIATSAVDTTPNAFAFTDVTGAVISTVTVSDVVAIAGINTAAAVTISGGEYRILNASDVEVSGYTTGAGSIAPTEKLQLRVTSSASDLTTVSTTVTVGGVSDTWSVETASGVSPLAINDRFAAIVYDRAASAIETRV